MLHSPSRSSSPSPSIPKRGGGTSTPPSSSRGRGSSLAVMMRPQQSRGQAARRRDIPLLTNDFLVNVGTASRVESLAGWNLVFTEGVGLSHTKRLQMAVRLFGPPLGETIGAAGNKVPICRWLLDLSSNAVFTTPAVTTPPTIDDQSLGEGLLRIEARPPLHVTSNLSRVVELFLWQTLLRSHLPLTATPRLSNASKSGLIFVPVKNGTHANGASTPSLLDVSGARAEQRVVEGTAEGGAAKLTVTLRNAKMQLSSSCPLSDFVRTVCDLRRAHHGLVSEPRGSEAWLPSEDDIIDFNRFLDTEVRVVHRKRRVPGPGRPPPPPHGLVVSCEHTGKKMYYTILRLRRCSERLAVDGREMTLREYYETYKLEGKKDWTCKLQQEDDEGGGLVVAEDWKGRVIPMELCRVEADQLLSVKPLTATTAEAPKASLSSVWLLRERLASSLPMLPRGRQQQHGRPPSGASEHVNMPKPDLEIDVQRRPLAVKGRVLPEITLEYRDKQKPMPCSQGSWVITGQQLKRCAKYTIPYGVLEVGECRGVSTFCEALRTIADGHGLKFRDEARVELKLSSSMLADEDGVQRLRDWCQRQLPDAGPAILFVFLPRKSRRPYCVVKDLVDRIAGVPSQVIVCPSSQRTINQWQSITCELCCKIRLKEPQVESPDEDFDGDTPPPTPTSPTGVLPRTPARVPPHGGVIAGVPRMTQQTSLFAIPNGRAGGGGEERSLVPRGCMVIAFTLERSGAVGGLWIATAVGSVDNDVNLYATASSVQDTGTRIIDVESLVFRLLE
ncbi:Eukaryotic translation initiation factor 2C, partial [Perkinsus olseni]